jgi:hypothetical protein
MSEHHAPRKRHTVPEAYDGYETPEANDGDGQF